MPALSMCRLGKDATPFTAATLTVPARVPPVGPVPMVTVTTLVALVTVKPDASWIATATTGPIAIPAVVLLGPSVKPSFTAVGPTGSVQAASKSTPPPTNPQLLICDIGANRPRERRRVE